MFTRRNRQMGVTGARRVDLVVADHLERRPVFPQLQQNIRKLQFDLIVGMAIFLRMYLRISFELGIFKGDLIGWAVLPPATDDPSWRDARAQP